MTNIDAIDLTPHVVAVDDDPDIRSLLRGYTAHRFAGICAVLDEEGDASGQVALSHRVRQRVNMRKRRTEYSTQYRQPHKADQVLA